MGLITVPEEVFSQILVFLGDVNPLGFFTSQRTCRRFRSTAEHLLTKRPVLLFTSMQPLYPLYERCMNLFPNWNDDDDDAEEEEEEHEEENEGNEEEAGLRRGMRAKQAQEDASQSSFDPLRARFGFLIASHYTEQIPGFKEEPHPLHQRMRGKDYFRCMPWAKTSSRESYLRPEASWRRITLLSGPDPSREQDDDCDTALILTSRTVVRHIEAVNIETVYGGSTVRFWPHVSYRRKTDGNRQDGRDKVDDGERGGLDQTNENEKRDGTPGDGGGDMSRAITLGLLWDLLLSRGRMLEWELLPGRKIDPSWEAWYPCHGYANRNDVYKGSKDDPETAILLTYEKRGCMPYWPPKGARERAEALDLWDPTPIDESVTIGISTVLNRRTGG
ncbi:hypothetical protein F4778DRAFT_752066 [Xylariomycetidae sp. FL2044]|nr:hypothetical protein F4778DRAFT_752066 [Xylariomycetidae sp. FL2044]